MIRNVSVREELGDGVIYLRLQRGSLWDMKVVGSRAVRMKMFVMGLQTRSTAGVGKLGYMNQP